MSPALTATRVLVVEDNPADAQLVRLMLDQTGQYLPRIEGRVASALASIAKSQPDVILLDLGLPDAQGLEAVDLIHRGSGQTPLVVLTGVDDEELALEALQHGAQDYLTKNDLTPRMLHRVLRYAIERQRMVEELRQARERVEALSRLDPLTGVLNRRGLEHELQREHLRAQRDNQTLQVVAWDLDDFKAVNDTHGHAAGDRVLVEVARRAGQAFRSTDLIARIGGDEFIAVLPGTRSAEGAITADRLRAMIAERPFQVDDRQIRATISVGLAEVADDRAPLASLLRAVDRELYRSKRGGKNRISSAARSAFPASYAAPELALAGILPRGEPLLALSDGAPVAFEVLSRTTLVGLESPADYFRACREQGCLSSADLRCLDTCIAACASLAPGLSCHVNLFPSTLLEVGGHEIVRRLQAAGDRPICLDLSEQQIVGEATELLPGIETIREAGFHVGLDHAGSRRSSLETLLALEPEVVKVDVKWTQHLQRSPRRQRELTKLLRLLGVVGCAIVLARPSSDDCGRILARICGSVNINPLWSDSTRSTALAPAGAAAEARGTQVELCDTVPGS